MSFSLHANLASKKHLLDLPLCRVLVENVRHYPWLILVPRRTGLNKVMDLSSEDRWQLSEETDLAQRVLWELTKPTQLNVAALGNKTPQLHVHVIARFEGDPAWPGTVWDHPAKEPYDQEAWRMFCVELTRSFAHIPTGKSLAAAAKPLYI